MMPGQEDIETTIVDIQGGEIKTKGEWTRAEMPRVKVAGAACIVTTTVTTGTLMSRSL